MDSTNKSSHSPFCIRSCGFYGSAQNHNMCSKCYNDYLKQEIIAKTTSLTLKQKINIHHHQFAVECPDSKEGIINTVGSSSSSVKNRCESCNKKVGLTGFACRCGKLFCGTHRYPKEHSCTFDYKMFDRQVLVKQNPLIKADKLDGKL